MPTVYIETSIVSHASARESRDPVVRALQLQARQWWDRQRILFDLYTSQLVLDEAALGDPIAADERRKLLEGIPLIDVSDRVRSIAVELLAQSPLPSKATIDALHIAAASASGMDYLLTQNCRHIANAHTLPRIYNCLRDLGIEPPLICTPAEFLEDHEDDDEPDS